MFKKNLRGVGLESRDRKISRSVLNPLRYWGSYNMYEYVFFFPKVFSRVTSLVQCPIMNICMPLHLKNTLTITTRLPVRHHVHILVQGPVDQSISRLTLLHSERPKLHTILAFLSEIGLMRSLDKDL